MMKTTYVVRYTSSQLQIRFQGGLPLRLFGGLFLLGGGYFLYHLVMGIVDSVRYGQMLLVFPGTSLELGGQIATMLGLPLQDKTETVNEEDFAEENEE